MESTGPIRPNIISRWTKFQAKEHPEKYDMDDGVVVVNPSKKQKNKFNLRKEETHELYSDSIVITKDKKAQEEKPVKKEEPKKPFFPRVKVCVLIHIVL